MTENSMTENLIIYKAEKSAHGEKNFFFFSFLWIKHEQKGKAKSKSEMTDVIFFIFVGR